jgi:membrane-associated phospholipid phosphatase
MKTAGRTIRLGRLELRALDGLILTALFLCALLAVAFSRRVSGWRAWALKDAGAAAVYLAVLSLAARAAKPNTRFLVRMAGILSAFIYINLAVADLQLIFHDHWLDGRVLGLEAALFGAQPTLWLQRFIAKPLTEWLFFCYVAYMFIYPVLGVLIFFKKGETAAEDYLLALGLSNIVCDLGFLAYPVAGPLAHMGGQYTVPLDGYFWTRFGEYLRAHWQFPGGTIPSPHCANATIMWLMAYRYVRPAFWTLAPVILSLYVSTVYCRYHYVTDSVIGIAAAIAVWLGLPACRGAWDRTALLFPEGRT